MALVGVAPSIFAGHRPEFPGWFSFENARVAGETLLSVAGDTFSTMGVPLASSVLSELVPGLAGPLRLALPALGFAGNTALKSASQLVGAGDVTFSVSAIQSLQTQLSHLLGTGIAFGAKGLFKSSLAGIFAQEMGFSFLLNPFLEISGNLFSGASFSEALSQVSKRFSFSEALTWTSFGLAGTAREIFIKNPLARIGLEMMQRGLEVCYQFKDSTAVSTAEYVRAFSRGLFSRVMNGTLHAYKLTASQRGLQRRLSETRPGQSMMQAGRTIANEAKETVRVLREEVGWDGLLGAVAPVGMARGNPRPVSNAEIDVKKSLDPHTIRKMGKVVYPPEEIYKMLKTEPWRAHLDDGEWQVTLHGWIEGHCNVSIAKINQDTPKLPLGVRVNLQVASGQITVTGHSPLKGDKTRVTQLVGCFKTDDPIINLEADIKTRVGRSTSVKLCRSLLPDLPALAKKNGITGEAYLAFQGDRDRLTSVSMTRFPPEKEPAVGCKIRFHPDGRTELLEIQGQKRNAYGHFIYYLVQAEDPVELAPQHLPPEEIGPTQGRFLREVLLHDIERVLVPSGNTYSSKIKYIDLEKNVSKTPFVYLARRLDPESTWTIHMKGSPRKGEISEFKVFKGKVEEKRSSHFWIEVQADSLGGEITYQHGTLSASFCNAMMQADRSLLRDPLAIAERRLSGLRDLDAIINDPKSKAALTFLGNHWAESRDPVSGTLNPSRNTIVYIKNGGLAVTSEIIFARLMCSPRSFYDAVCFHPGSINIVTREAPEFNRNLQKCLIEAGWLLVPLQE